MSDICFPENDPERGGDALKLFFAYLRVHYKSVILFAAFTAICTAVFYLSSLPLSAVLYAFILCMALAALCTAISFSRFVSRHRALVRMQNAVSAGLEGLPSPRGLIEEDWRALLSVLFEAKRCAESDKAAYLSEMNDYYTLWAHQVKTPIAAMRLLLQADTEPDISALDEQLFRIEQYVDMVLQYVRTESPSGDYVLRSYDIDGIVRAEVRRYAKLFIKKKITLDYQPLGFCAVTDDKWLGFVVGQIISNSVKYTPEGGHIRIKPGSAPKTFVIEDDGIGISEEDMPRIFEKGYTGYNGRADKKSTGIGLYLCRLVLQKLGHSISAESRIGKGTAMTVDLYSVKVIE